ncbi:MAG: hypothetical protein KC636_06695 [Myxococcales bacterium]|nr:hypothetical protein [Myxococcales bacterium]
MIGALALLLACRPSATTPPSPSEPSATAAGEGAQDAPVACDRCVLEDGACGSWYEDGDEERTYAAFFPCDERCCVRADAPAQADPDA